MTIKLKISETRQPGTPLLMQNQINNTKVILYIYILNEYQTADVWFNLEQFAHAAVWQRPLRVRTKAVRSALLSLNTCELR